MAAECKRSTASDTAGMNHNHFVNPASKLVEIIQFPEDIDHGAPTFLLKEIEAILEDHDAKKLPVFIISITGVFRSGKSFLLNLMKTYLQHYAQNGSDEGWESCKGMQIKGGVWAQSKKAVTHGIWMWDHPFIVNGIAILLVDCQGTDDTINGSPTLDNLILYLSLQMAQVELLNFKGTLQSSDLQRLQLCAEYADVGDDSHASETIFDSLIFLVRDWQNGGPLGELDNEFEDTLNEAKSEEVRQIGEGIKKAFDLISTFAFPYPGGKVTNSSEKSNLTIGDVDETFTLAAKTLFQKLFLELPKVKTLRNGKETMRMFEGLQERVVDEKLSLIKIHTGADALEESLMHKAFVEASKFYDDEMIKTFGMQFDDEEAVEEHLDNVVAETIRMFKNKKSVVKYKESSSKEKYLGLLRKKGDHSALDERKKYILNAQELYQKNLEYERMLKAQQEEKEKIEKEIELFAEEKAKRDREELNEELKERNREQKERQAAKQANFQRQLSNSRKEIEIKLKMEKEIRLAHTRSEINRDQEKMEAELKEQKMFLDQKATLLRNENEKESINELEKWVDSVDKETQKKYTDKEKCKIL